MKIEQSANKPITFISTLIPMADAFFKFVPLPSGYEALIQFPTIILCLCIFLFPVLRKRNFALIALPAGAVLFIIYLIMASFLLHSYPATHPEGSNSVIGFWMESWAEEEFKASQLQLSAFLSSFSPEEWSAIYSKWSQLSTVGVLGLTYAFTFASITFGFLQFEAHRSETPRD